ncbi:MAG: hypothetical protein QM731_13610 [Chitinophagaceae bacterium]
MKKHVHPVIAGLIVLFLVSCTSGKDKLSKTWFYTLIDNASLPTEARKESNTSTSSSKDPVLTPVNFLNLQRDGSYSCYFSDFEYGTWNYENKHIILKDGKGHERKLTVFSVSDKELKMDIEPANNDVNSYSFEGIINPYANTADDPYAPANNQWRIKARAKEDEEAIKKRLLNHFRYWEKYFAWGLKTDRQTLDVRSLAGPLKIYGNGFELLPLDKWSEEWTRYFYDADDAAKAYDQLRWFFTNERIAWPKTDHKFKQFISAYQQLQQKL